MYFHCCFKLGFFIDSSETLLTPKKLSKVLRPYSSCVSLDGAASEEGAIPSML